MSGQEGRFFETLGMDGKTFIPGGAEIDGEVKIKKNDFINETFRMHPVCMNKAGIVASGVNGAENIMLTNESSLEYHMNTTGGTATIIAPQLVYASADEAGLDVEGDGTDNVGMEITPGILASNKAAFTIGSAAAPTKAFYAKLSFYIDDVTDFDDCAFGFRLSEAYQGSIDSYNDMAVINIISGVVNLETILNGGSTVTTDTTLPDWADQETHELEVRVSAAGVVTYKYDSSTPTVVAAFTFDTGDVVVPFFYFLHAASAATGLVLKNFECGLQ